MLLFAGCGADDQLASGTQVRIAPENVNWTVTERLDADGNCIFVEEDYQDTYFVITVADRDGRLIGEADLDINLSPSNSTSTPAFNDQFFYYLYDDTNQNGVPDHPAELVSGSSDPIVYSTTTEEYHGTKSIIVRTNTSCGGGLATLSAFAGDGFGTADITTEADNENN